MNLIVEEMKAPTEFTRKVSPSFKVSLRGDTVDWRLTGN